MPRAALVLQYDVNGECLLADLVRSCGRSDEIQLSVDVHYYRMCEKKYQCEQ